MKRTLLVITLLYISTSGIYAQKKKEQKLETPSPVYIFTDLKTIPTTSVKNQANSGTCWCYSTLGTVEADILKEKGIDVDLSDMWVVRHTYFEKAVKYVRMHGMANLSQGGNAHDVINMIDKYGIVPESVYSGLQYGTDKNVFGEIDGAIGAYTKVITGNPNGQLSEGWLKGLNGILDAYFGELPAKFTIDGKEYTPKEYADYLGFSSDNYISVTSFSHHPFGTSFAVEIPDNWAWGESLNIPLSDFMQLSEDIVNSGYTLAWGADVSEKGFKYKDTFAVLPETEVKNMTGSDQAKWTGASHSDIFEFKQIAPEIDVTQESRQKWFDNYQTTDDHGMVVCGTATDQNGNKYFKVKNSWGESNPLKGYFYVSYPFYKGKTINILFNKKSLSDIWRSKLKPQ